MPDLFYQTRPEAGYPPEVTVFADALEDVMADGTYDPAGIAAGLNARKITAGGITEWTADRLTAYLAQLANA